MRLASSRGDYLQLWLYPPITRLRNRLHSVLESEGQRFRVVVWGRLFRVSLDRDHLGLIPPCVLLYLTLILDGVVDSGPVVSRHECR
jgi:hypothetical protein